MRFGRILVLMLLVAQPISALCRRDRPCNGRRQQDDIEHQRKGQRGRNRELSRHFKLIQDELMNDDRMSVNMEESDTEDNVEYYTDDETELRPNMEDSVDAQPTDNPNTTPLTEEERMILNEQWRERERSKQTRLFIIQQQILAKMGLSRRPNVTMNVSTEELNRLKSMLRNKTKTSSLDGSMRPAEDYYSKRIQTLLPSCSIPRNSDETWLDGQMFRLYFAIDLPERLRVKNIRVNSATLRLKRKPLTEEYTVRLGNRFTPRKLRLLRRDAREDFEKLPDVGSLKVTVYHYNKPVRVHSRESAKIVDWQIFSKNYEGWLQFDIKSSVEIWIKRRRRNFGLEISVTDHLQRELYASEVFYQYDCSTTAYSQLLPLTLSMTDETNRDINAVDDNITSPNLNVVSVELPKKRYRVRRDLSTKNGDDCRMETSYISFEALHMSQFILSPHGFEAGFCVGTCPPNDVGHLMENFRDKKENNLQNERNVARQCCSPTGLRPLSYLYYSGNDEIALSTINNLIVTDFGCTA